jgi:hypothetical protein
VLVYSLLLLLALISRESFWTKVHFDKRIDSFVFSHAHGCILNDIEGVEDSMFVHIVFKCNKNSNLRINLGELPYFI